MKIAMFDIETSNLNADYGILLCAVIKPLEKKPIALRLDETKRYKVDKADDSELVEQIRKELQNYDIIVLCPPRYPNASNKGYFITP